MPNKQKMKQFYNIWINWLLFWFGFPASIECAYPCQCRNAFCSLLFWHVVYSSGAPVSKCEQVDCMWGIFHSQWAILVFLFWVLGGATEDMLQGLQGNTFSVNTGPAFVRNPAAQSWKTWIPATTGRGGLAAASSCTAEATSLTLRFFHLFHYTTVQHQLLYLTL